MTFDELAELMSEPPGGENHGRVRTEGGWRSLEPDYARYLPYVVVDPDYRSAIPTSEHGTRARYVRGCRCDPCRAANRDYMRARRSVRDDG